MKTCPKCGHVFPRRSNDISTRFHGWISHIAGDCGLNRNLVYFDVLTKCIDEEIVADGGSPYPFALIDRVVEVNGVKVEATVLEPAKTSSCTNKQMMSACLATEIYAAERGIVLPEREE